MEGQRLRQEEDRGRRKQKVNEGGRSIKDDKGRSRRKRSRRN